MQSPTTNWKEAGSLGAIGLIVFVLWGTPVIYPLKILVVFFHEFSHGMAALMTGGRIIEIQISPLQGGLCISQGGNRFLILTAGYLGSLVLGGMILLYGSRTRGHGKVTTGLGVLLLAVTFIWVRPIIGFGFIFGLGIGIAMMFVGLNMSLSVNRYLLKAIGFTSCLYAPLDIVSDVLARPGVVSDATMLAEHTGLPGFVWGLLWTATALGLSFLFLTKACKNTDSLPIP